ncbi:hypothetical protein BDY17DRAFT_310962 [Neohortaea acidophila]|uniref:Uncharacterized protein n=1 Tax=Neohortaea acidophila TaxID=245834 RepID=A0A6A6PRE9_9PEZI|nr:uncharacterized protein BDY17DRAFT_310962 [Neohortaea acidophila]KAF2482495.1 hypothetical protein BDY17DRAFT_310962 [Neohortaea acidophila]
MSDDANEALTATAPNTTNNLPPLVTHWDLNSNNAAGPSDTRYSTPLGIFYDSEGSLDPSFWQNCPHDHPNIATMLTPDSVPRSAVSWSGETISPVSQTQPPLFPSIPMAANDQRFADQSQCYPFSSAGDFTTVTSDASTLNVPSSFWPATDSSMMDFSPTTTNLGQSLHTIESLNESNKQHINQVFPTANDNITSNYPSATQYFAPQHSNLAPTSMHHYTSQPLYLTPPDEPGGWPAQLQSYHGWTEAEVYQATARALAAQQEHSGAAFPSQWGGEGESQGMG